MKLENQVTSLELSRKLKELGVKQEGFWYWYHEKQKRIAGWKLKQRHQVSDFCFEIWSKEKLVYSAFTVAELGEMLPKWIIIDGISQVLTCERHSIWVLKYGDKVMVSAGDKDTEADSRAKMLIYLIENGLIKQ